MLDTADAPPLANGKDTSGGAQTAVADVVNAKLLNQSVGEVITALSDNNGDVVTALESIATAIATLGRTRCSSNVTFYVRTDGNDNNNGLTNTAAGAFLTIQGAITALARDWDFAKYQPTISVGAGTFSGGIVSAHPWVGVTYPLVVGQGDTTIIQATANSQSIIFVTDDSVLGIDNVKLTTGGFSGVVGLHATQNGIFDYGRINFGASLNVGVLADNAGMFNQTGPCRISGNGNVHVQALRPGSRINIFPGVTASITNSVNNGAGLYRLTVSGTAATYMATGYPLVVSGAAGAANGTWLATVINATTVDLQGTGFTAGGAGGTITVAAYILDGPPSFTTAFAVSEFGANLNSGGVAPVYVNGPSTGGQQFFFAYGGTDTTGAAGIGATTSWPGTTRGQDASVWTPVYTTAALPSAASIAGALSYVSDDSSSGAAALAYSDGSSWLRVETRRGPFILEITRDMSAASASVSYSGTGFKPRAVTLFAAINGGQQMSIGMADYLMRPARLSTIGTFAQGVGIAADYSLVIFEDTVGTKYQTAVVTSYDASGFTLSWVRSPTVPAVAGILCYAMCWH